MFGNLWSDGFGPENNSTGLSESRLQLGMSFLNFSEDFDDAIHSGRLTTGSLTKLHPLSWKNSVKLSNCLFSHSKGFGNVSFVRMRLMARLSIVLLLPVWLGGCLGYQIRRTSDATLRYVYGIQRVYVRPIVNDTYHPGTENLIYSQVLRMLSAQSGVQIVRDESQAEAVVSGRVADASYTISALTTTDRLFPSSLNVGLQGASDTAIAAEYRASLTFELSLTRKNPTQTLWGGTFNRVQTFPANFQLGSYGSTSNLINESEFERTLKDLAQNLMLDVRESLLSRF